jgi:hypothetical protein
MALISAHSEETSDAIYGGDEAAIYEASVNDIDLYRLCSVIFNDFVGITTSEPEARARLASIAQTPPTAPKVKRRAEKEGSEEQSSSREVDDYILHRVPEDYYSPKAQKTGPFCFDKTASSSNPLAGSKGKSKAFVTEHDKIDMLWEELSREVKEADVQPLHLQKRERPAHTPLRRRDVRLPSLSKPLHTEPNVQPSPCPDTIAIQTPPSLPTAVHAVASASLEVVTDFSFQAKVWSKIEESLRCPGNGSLRLLAIQPTSSGKGKYARDMARRPGNMHTRKHVRFCR